MPPLSRNRIKYTVPGTPYYQNDHLGTPQKLITASGAVVWAAEYEGFGRAHAQINSVANPLRFPGQYYDAETGTHYNYFRDYDPSTGRYVEGDPVGLIGGVNAYIYAIGNPNSFIDNYGLDSTKKSPNPRLPKKIIPILLYQKQRAIQLVFTRNGVIIDENNAKKSETES